MKAECGAGQSERASHVVHLTGGETSALVDSVQTWRYKVDPRQHGFFLAKKRRANLILDSSDILEENAVLQPTTPGTPDTVLGFTWEIGLLAEYEQGFFDGIAEEDRYISFADPSTYPEYPGWMLRNYLILVRQRWKLDKAQVLCFRDTQARRDDARSLVVHVEVEGKTSTNRSQDTLLAGLSGMPKVTGWERNGTGKVMSRIADLGEYMDPQR